MTQSYTTSLRENIRYTNICVRQANFDADLMKVLKRLSVKFQEAQNETRSQGSQGLSQQQTA